MKRELETVINYLTKKGITITSMSDVYLVTAAGTPKRLQKVSAAS